MIIDASALLAVLLEEPDAEAYLEAIDQSPHHWISPVNYVEAGNVVEGRGGKTGLRLMDTFLEESAIAIATITPRQAFLAREAYRDFGKGRHPAALNLGDCFAYALSRDKREPLLFKGTDFAQTDVESALP